MGFKECFSKVQDPRRGQGLRTDLDQILTMVVVSYLCGHFGYRGVHRFSKINSKDFIEFLQLRHGVPSHMSFARLLPRLNKKELITAFKCWSKDYVPLENKDWLAVDGKALGSTLKNSQSKKQDFEAVVSLFAHKSGLVRSVEHYRKKSKGESEAPIARHLMSELKNMGLIFTMDAGNTQKND